MCSRKRNHKHNSMGQLRFNPLKPPLVTHKSIRPALRTTVFFNRRKPKVVPAETIGGEPGPAEAATEETYRIPCRIMISGTSKQRGRSREMFYSMPMPSQLQHDTLNEHFRYLPKDDSYSLFRTRSTMRQQSKNNMELELQSGTPRTTEITENTIVSAGRYLDTLQGPDLDILKDESEGILLPLDEQWPFLLRFPIGCFGVSLGLGGQAILWKTLGVNLSMKFLHISLVINLTIWCLALISLISIFITYLLKCFFYFEAVKREYQHPVRMNFFFAPWIACMFLALGLPPVVEASIHPAFSCLFMVPVIILELKIYGQWLLGGDRRLSKMANPSTHLAVVGNFIGSFLAATVGWKELALFFWAVGLAHYLVLLVTLYQRLPTTELLPKDLHPIFFLFIAAPNAASTAWETIVGDFDSVSRILFFLGLFFYSCLVVRLNLFRGFRFSVAWWAYTYPMSASANATIHYCNKVRHPFAQGLAVLLSLISVITVFSLLVSSLLHAFLWGTLFPNDVAIAITAMPCKTSQSEKADTGSNNSETVVIV